MAVVGVKNTCAKHEAGINKQYKRNQSNLASYTQKIMEMVQVPTMAKDDAKELITAAIQGRYGKDGSKAVFQFLQEQNHTVDAALYRNLQQAMEAGRDAFDNNQAQLMDRCGVYEEYMGTSPSGDIAGFIGFPNEGFLGDEDDPDIKCNPVITKDTAEAFGTKRSAPLQLRPSK